MATYYWVGGSGTWNTTTTTNWSLSSGGGGGAGVPTATDNVIINPSSGTGTITCASSICADLTITATQAITLGAGVATLSVRGNFALPTGGSFTYNTSTNLVLGATTTGKTVDCGGRDLGPITFSGVGGGWTLTSALSASASTISILAGSFNSAGFTVTCNIFSTSGTTTRSITLGSSTINTASWSMSAVTGLTFSAGTSNLNITSSATTFTGGALTYNNVNFTSTTATLITLVATASPNTYANLTFAGKTTTGITDVNVNNTHTITGTLTVSAPATAGSMRYSFRTNAYGSSRTISAATVNLTDCDFMDIATGGSWSGTRLGDRGGNSGITFPAAKTVYWNLAGSNKFYDNGWATTSTGVPANANFPLPQDTATFTDVAPTTGNTITSDVVFNVGSIDFSARTVNITFNNTANLSVHGSTTLSSATVLGAGSGSWSYLKRGGTQTITSAGNTWNSTLTVNAIGGTVRLLDACARTATVGFQQSTLDLNGFNLTCTSFSTISSTKTLAFGSGGSITATGSGTAISINAGGLTVTHAVGVYPRVICTNPSSTATTINMPNAVGSGGLIDLYVTSGTYALTIGNNSFVRSLDFSGFSGSVGNTTYTVCGDFTASTGMTFSSGSAVLSFANSSTSPTSRIIRSNGRTLNGPVTVNVTGNTCVLLDALTILSNLFTLTNGTVDLNGFACSIGTFATGAGTKNITFDGSTLTVTGSGSTAFNNAAPTGFTTTAGTGAGAISMTSATAKTFVGGGSTYNCTLNQGGAGALTISGNNTLNNITNSVTPATVTFTASSTNTFANFNLNGTAGNLITINSSTAGTRANLVKTGADVSCDYLDIKDTAAS